MEMYYYMIKFMNDRTVIQIKGIQWDLQHSMFEYSDFISVELNLLRLPNTNWTVKTFASEKNRAYDYRFIELSLSEPRSRYNNF